VVDAVNQLIRGRLLNNDKTKITILGSGTCVPSLERSSAAVLVTTGESRILLDLGDGTLRRLLEAGHRVGDISHVLITHFHPDHTGALASFLFSNKYPEPATRRGPLTLMGGPGFVDFFRRFGHVYGRWIELPPEKIRLKEVDPMAADGIDFGDFHLSWAPVNHNPESLAYRIRDEAGKSMVYSGDTDESESLKRLAKGADLLICESALPDALKVPGHLSPALAGGIAADARVGKLVLTHFYPECDTADMAGECRRTYDGPLVLAEDLMEIVL
jgi:ribonuclease BN (tRNA processing enzyme)